MGAVVELFAQRKGEMVDLIPSIQVGGEGWSQMVREAAGCQTKQGGCRRQHHSRTESYNEEDSGIL